MAKCNINLCRAWCHVTPRQGCVVPATGSTIKPGNECRVVSNFGDRNSGEDEIHARARNFEGSVYRAQGCIWPESPKLETT